MKNIKLDIQYDGTDYHGWQIQKNAVTIQGIMTKAVSDLCGSDTQIIGCGRTDSGVHAESYICNFLSDISIPPEKIPFALNHRLPDDIICKSAEYMPFIFHSKNSAAAKTYVYNVYNSSFPNVFNQKYSWHIKGNLNINNMILASKSFLGEHDFIGFASSGFSVKTTIRTIYSLNISQNDKMIVLSVTGNGFLYNMVRIIAGTLVFVGLGKINPHDMTEILNSKDRTRAGITAPPNGLFLKEVFYEKK